MSSTLKIGLLVAVHVVGELVLAWSANPRAAASAIPFAFFGLFPLLFAEAGLIGVWGGLSSTRLAWRLLAVIAATVYLWVVPIMAIRVGDKISVFLVIAVTAVTILVVLVVLRHSRRRLRLVHLKNESPASEGFQFSIRNLLLATALVAAVLGVGRVVRTVADRQWESILAVAIFPPCFVMVELATLWAALGIGRPIPRLAVVVPIAFVVGTIPVFYLPVPTGRESWLFFIWPIIVTIQAIITACSLLVIRSCGWRLVRGDGNEIEPLPTPPGLDRKDRRADDQRR